MDKLFHPTFYWVVDYLPMLGLKLIHVTNECCLISEQYNSWYILEINILKSEQNGHHLTDSILRFIFLKLIFCILIQISLNFLSKALIYFTITLTHFPLVPHISVSESGQHLFRLWLVAFSAPSHYINQWWVVAKWTLRNKLQWNFYQNTKFFIHKNTSEITVYKLAAILSRERWFN